MPYPMSKINFGIRTMGGTFEFNFSGDSATLLYQEAVMCLVKLNPSKVIPLSYYVLKPKMEMIKWLHNILANSQIDLLRLDETVYSLDLSWREGIARLSPPIVEVHDGQLLLVDGLHRFLYAKQIRYPFVTPIEIVGAFANLPCLPLAWEKICEITEVPPLNEKRRFATGNLKEDYELFRDLLKNYSFVRETK